MAEQLRTTLGKEHTFTFFCGSDGPFPGGEESKNELRKKLWNDLHTQWSELVANDDSDTKRPEIILLYQILRGKDYRKAFGLVTNETKLTNGMRPDIGLRTALCLLRLRAGGSTDSVNTLIRPFTGLIDSKTVEDIMKIIPDPSKLPVTVNYKEAMPYCVEVPAAQTISLLKKQKEYVGGA